MPSPAKHKLDQNNTAIMGRNPKNERNKYSGPFNGMKISEMFDAPHELFMRYKHAVENGLELDQLEAEISVWEEWVW